MIKRFLRSPGALAGVTSLALASLSMVVVMACSNSDPAVAGPDLSPEPPDLSLVDFKAPDYPSGPFGGDVNKIMPNFTFQGYWSPTSTAALATTQPFGEVTFEMARKSGAKYALVQLAAFW